MGGRFNRDVCGVRLGGGNIFRDDIGFLIFSSGVDREILMKWRAAFQGLYVFAHDPDGERYGRGGNQFPLTLHGLHGDSVTMTKIADDFLVCTR